MSFYLPPFEIRTDVLSFLITEMLQLILEDADKPARVKIACNQDSESRPFWAVALVRPSAKCQAQKVADDFRRFMYFCVHRRLTRS